jgi:phosphate starvation-inducible PhoH-like protein
LAELCGSNDVNLRELEQLLGSPVFCRGNELFFDSADAARRDLFSRLVRELINQSKEGTPLSPDTVRSLFTSLSEPDSELSGGSAQPIHESYIQIPGGLGRIYPKSARQAAYVRDMAAKELCFGVGPAGTGKTFLAMAYALREVLSRRKRKLILTRPVVEAGENLGFLPGDLNEKINPYLRPLYDAMESMVPYEALRRMEENNVIEVAPLAYMRGRTLNNCIVILDEAQNTTREQMKMFLTRLGLGSKAIVTGDVTQVDLPRKVESGLAEAIRVLAGIEEIGIDYLDAQDVARNPLIKKIIRAYEHDHE